MLNPTQTQVIVAAGRTITIATRGDPALGPLTRHSPDSADFVARIAPLTGPGNENRLSRAPKVIEADG